MSDSRSYGAVSLILFALGLSMLTVYVDRPTFPPRGIDDSNACGYFPSCWAARLMGHVPNQKMLQQHLLSDNMNKEVSLLEIKDALSQCNIESAGVSLSFDDVVQLKHPIILHLNNPGHFVVGSRTDDGFVFIDGREKWTNVDLEIVKSRMSGYGLVIIKSGPVENVLRQADSGPVGRFNTLFVQRVFNDNFKKPVRFEFYVRNTGDSPLEYEVQTSCKCTAPAENTGIVLPGEGQTIGIDFHPKPGQSQSEEYVVFNSNDKYHKSIPLGIGLYAKQTIRVLPSSVDFGVCDNATEFRSKIYRDIYLHFDARDSLSVATEKSPRWVNITRLDESSSNNSKAGVAKYRIEALRSQLDRSGTFDGEVVFVSNENGKEASLPVSIWVTK